MNTRLRADNTKGPPPEIKPNTRVRDGRLFFSGRDERHDTIHITVHEDSARKNSSSLKTKRIIQKYLEGKSRRDIYGSGLTITRSKMEVKAVPRPVGSDGQTILQLADWNRLQSSLVRPSHNPIRRCLKNRKSIWELKKASSSLS